MGFFGELKRDMFPPIDEHTTVPMYEDDTNAGYDNVDRLAANRGYNRSGRTLKIALTAVGGLAVLGGIVYATADTGSRPSASAEADPSSDANVDSGETSPTPTESTSGSPSPSPSPTHTKESASPTPKETMSATSVPRPTASHRVVVPVTPKPTTSSPAPEGGACHMNPNASSPDYRHREVICNEPAQTYTNSDGATPAFEINGPALIDCLDAEGGFAKASISNEAGWLALTYLGTDVCN